MHIPECKLGLLLGKGLDFFLNRLLNADESDGKMPNENSLTLIGEEVNCEETFSASVVLPEPSGPIIAI